MVVSDVLALYSFQFSYRSPTKGFKRVPDGINQNTAHERKALARREQA